VVGKPVETKQNQLRHAGQTILIVESVKKTAFSVTKVVLVRREIPKGEGANFTASEN